MSEETVPQPQRPPSKPSKPIPRPERPIPNRKIDRSEPLPDAIEPDKPWPRKNS